MGAVDKSGTQKWISVRRFMPPMRRHYCCVTSAYQSEVVRVKTQDGTEFNASLQLYGNNIRGWASEWWKDGLLSDRTKIEDVVCWQTIGFQEDDSTAQTFEEALEGITEYRQYLEELAKKREEAENVQE